MAEKLITAIRTEEGDLKIDYQALANKPQFDADWKAANKLADADKVKSIESKVNQAATEIGQLADDIEQLEATVGALGGDLGDLGNQGFITGSAVDNKLLNYVKNTEKATKGSYGIVKVGDGLNVSDGVISVAQDDSGEDYLTKDDLPIASNYQAGIVQIGTGLSISSGVLSMTSDSLPKASNYSQSQYGAVLPSTNDFKCSNGYLQLEQLTLAHPTVSNVHVLTSQVGANQSGHWYLIPAESGDG